MRQARRPLAFIALALMIALAGCTTPDEAGEPDAEASAGGAGGGGGGGGGDEPARPGPNHTLETAATGDTPRNVTVSVERGDSQVVAELEVERSRDDGAGDGLVAVALRFLDPDGNLLLEREVHLHPGETTQVETHAPLSGLTNYWNANPDAEWAPVTLQVAPEAGSVDARGFFGVR